MFSQGRVHHEKELISRQYQFATARQDVVNFSLFITSFLSETKKRYIRCASDFVLPATVCKQEQLRYTPITFIILSISSTRSLKFQFQIHNQHLQVPLQPFGNAEFSFNLPSRYSQ